MVSGKIEQFEQLSDNYIVDFILGENCIYYNDSNTYKLDKQHTDSESSLFYNNENVFPDIGNIAVFESSCIANGWYISARDNQSELRFTCKKEDGTEEFELFKDINGCFGNNR